ncbi:hypothetical protein LSAT2_017725 [Lamellibrachia satsuma]|nr:hypothetical protein LSAT2_017725 [Lamellibrachia satsuma]
MPLRPRAQDDVPRNISCLETPPKAARRMQSPRSVEARCRCRSCMRRGLISPLGTYVDKLHHYGCTAQGYTSTAPTNGPYEQSNQDNVSSLDCLSLIVESISPQSTNTILNTMTVADQPL